MLRLSADQYRNTVADIFDGKLAASAQFPTATTEISRSGFSTDPEATAVTQLDADLIAAAAEDTALEVAGRLAEFLPCYPAARDAACADELIDTYGPRALRRPLTADERSLLRDVFMATAADGFDVGIAVVVQTLLQLPAFLYRVEIGEQDAPAAGSVIALTPHELATRLSYLFWETTPDTELLATAGSGELLDPLVLRAQAERLLDDPRAARAITRFYREWTGLRVFAAGEKDPVLYPELDAALAQSMQDSFDRFVVEATVGAQDAQLATLQGLLTRSDVFSDARMAAVYGWPSPSGTGMTRVEVTGTPMAGILTQPALLAGLAHEATTSPVHRGHFVRTKLLCGELGSPPADAQSRQPMYPPNATERDKSEALMAVPVCGGCHRMMNPIGLSFETFDALGRHRKTYADGTTIDPAGEILAGGSASGAIADVRALGQTLAQSDEVRACMARQWLRFTLSRKDDAADSCALDVMGKRFAGSGYALRELLLSITAPEALRHRTLIAEEVAP